MSILILQQTLASLFKRSSKNIVPAKHLELLASMELRWFEPAEARKLIEGALSMGLLEELEVGLKPTFNYTSVIIPLGFKPPKNLLDELSQEKDSLFIQLVNHISIALGIEPQKIIAEINNKQAKVKEYLTLEVLAILYGQSHGINMDKFIPEVKSKILSSSP